MLPAWIRGGKHKQCANRIIILGLQQLPSTAGFAAAADAQHGDAGADFTDTEALKEHLVDEALRHVKQLGWSGVALAAAARDLGLSPAAAGLIPGGGAGLVASAVRRANVRLQREAAAAREYWREQQQQQPAAQSEAFSGRPGEAAAEASFQRLAAGLSSPDPRRRLSAALRRRLEIGVAPHIDTWPSALAALASPGPGGAAPTPGATSAAAGAAGGALALRLLAETADEVAAAAAGDAGAVGLDWYAGRALVGGVYASTELYMLTDFSPDFRETWTQLDRRLADVESLSNAAEAAGGAARALLSQLAGLARGGGGAGAGRGGDSAGAAAGEKGTGGWQAGGGADGPAGVWPGADVSGGGARGSGDPGHQSSG